MSDTEEKSKHKVAVEPIVVVVNQQSSTTSRVKPYSTEMENEPSDGLHKRSKIPAIPLAEEIKEEGVAHIEVNKDESSEQNTQTQADTGLSKHQASSMLSAHSRVPEIIKPYETIVLGALESEPVMVIPSEPKPLEIKPVKSRGSVHSVKAVEEKSDEDLSEDVAALPTREATRISDWEATDESQKNQISWDDAEYLDKVQVQMLSEARLVFEEDYPVSPSSSTRMPAARPCGLSLHLPQKSMTDFSTTKTGIHIVISKASLPASKSQFNFLHMEDKRKELLTRKSEQITLKPHCLSVFREKIDTAYNKIIQYFSR